MRNPVCFLLTVLRSLRCGAIVLGHDFATVKEPTPENIHAMECMRCGKAAIAWDWQSVESSK